MNQKFWSMDRLESSVFFCIWLSIVSYTAYLNLSWSDWYNADTIAEMTYAQLVWEQKTPFPYDWHFTTETFLNRPFPLAALFYGLSGNFSAAYAWAITASGLLFSYIAYGYLSFLKVKTATIFFGLSCFWGMFINWVFLFALLSYGYTGMFSVVLLTLWAYQSGSRKLWALSLVCAFFMGLGSLRMLVILYIPLLAFDACNLLCTKGRRRETKSRAGLFPTGLLLCNLGGYLFLKYVLARYYDISFSSSHPEFISPSQLLENISLTWNSVFTMLQLDEPVMLAIVFLAMGSTAYGFLSLSYPKERRQALMFFFLSEMTAFGSLMVLNGWYAARYHVSISFFVIMALIFLLDEMLFRFRSVFILASGTLLVIFGIYNTYCYHLPTLKDGVASLGFGPKEAAVVEYLSEQKIQRAYASYWYAAPLKMISGGQIEAGHFTVSSLEPFLWGTDGRLYQPDSYHEKVAVVLTKEEESHLNDEGRQILEKGTFQKEIGNMYRVYFFEKNPIVLRESRSK